LGEQIKKQIGIGQPGVGGPIGNIGFFFYALSVELAERKAIDGENVAIVSVQPMLEFQ
jgi:hypothetical protein